MKKFFLALSLFTVGCSTTNPTSNSASESISISNSVSSLSKDSSSISSSVSSDLVSPFNDEYKVFLDKQDGIGGSIEVTATFGEPMPSASAPEKIGYDFMGYFEYQNGTGQKYYDSDMVSVMNWDKKVSWTLFAHWEEIDNTDNLAYTLIEDGVNFAYKVKKRIDNLEGTVLIPAMHDGLPVIEIEPSGFADCPKLLNIIFEEDSHVKVIGQESFKDSWRLTAITIPNSVLSIGAKAFSGCRYLASISVPFVGSSRSAINNDEALFGHIFGISEYENSVAVTQYSNSSSTIVYQLPKTLKSVRVTSPTLLSYGAFSGCRNLTDVIIADSVTTMNSSIFRDCGNLTNLTIPFVGQVKDGEGSYMLLGWFFGSNSYTGGISTMQYSSSSTVSTYYIPKSLKKVTLTNQTKLSYGAFYNCSNIETIYLPNNLVSIKERVFYNCANIEEITIPASVNEISDQAFGGCNKLADLIVATGNLKYKSSDGILYNLNGTSLLRYSPAKLETTFISSQDLKLVGRYSFHNATNLTNIEMKDNVTDIESSAFSGCSGIQTMTLPFIGLRRDIATGDWGIFGCIFGSTSYTGGTSTMQYTSSISTSTVHIPSALRTVNITDASYIRYGAFSGCSKLTNISIQGNATTIEDRAFYECAGLSKLTLPSSITAIGQSAFYDCTGLGSIVIDSKVTNIGYAAFSGWKSNQTINIRGLSAAPQSWNAGWDYNCKANIVWNYQG